MISVLWVIPAFFPILSGDSYKQIGNLSNCKIITKICCWVLNKGFQVMYRIEILKSNFCLESQGMLYLCLLYPHFLTQLCHLSPVGREGTAWALYMDPELRLGDDPLLIFKLWPFQRMLSTLTIVSSLGPLVLLYGGICVSFHVPFRSNSSLVQFFPFSLWLS